MSDFDRSSARTIPAAADMSVDVGLRKFMLGVYNKMALGLGVSAFMAWLTSGPLLGLLFAQNPATGRYGFTLLGMIVSFAPLAILLFGAFAIRNATPRSSGIIYWSVVTLIGASMGSLLLAYTGTSVVSTFLITATAFGALSLFGYSTKRDLTGVGSFLIMGLWGLIIASIVNMFLHSGPMGFIISVVGVLIFAGLTAYDTQRLKMTYYQLGGDQGGMAVATNYGALNLYLDFINLFQMLLSLLGSRR
jgi:FtsH-binding integral membrane protein